MEWHKGIICKVEHLEPELNVKQAFKIRYYNGDEKGYYENDVTVEIKKDGALVLFDDNFEKGVIYLYPEQAKLLKKILSGKN